MPRSWFRRPVVWLVAMTGLLAGLGIYVAPRAMRVLELRSGDRAVRRAAEFLAKGDLQHAMLDARRALDENPGNVEANRIIAQALERAGAPEAREWRRRLDSIRPGDAENLIAWAKDTLIAGYPEAATDILGRVKAGERNSAVHHDVAARIAIALGDAAGAESHWAEAAKLEPGSERYRLNLAVLRRNSGDAKAREEALDALRELSAMPEGGAAAREALFADAMACGDIERAGEMAAALASGPGAAFRDRLQRLSLLKALRDPEFSRLLSELRAGAVANPGELYELLSWMNAHDLALLVLDWLPDLPPAVVAVPPVCVPVAEARARAMEWKKLKEQVEAGAWGEFEFARLAYKARALEKLGEPSGSETAWNGAMKAAAGNPHRIETLANLASAWRWDDRSAEAFWKLANSGFTSRRVLDALWTSALRRGDTKRMRDVSRLRLAADPRNIEIKNNLVCLSLLAGGADAEVHKSAEALYKEAPDNPRVIATHALSLYQREMVVGALNMMRTMKPGQLREPGKALYYGIFLAANGEAGEAAEYLDIGETGPLLPEEKAMLEKAREAVRVRLKNQADK